MPKFLFYILPVVFAIFVYWSMETTQQPLEWDHSPEQILQLADQLVKEGRELDDLVASTVDNASFKNTIAPIAHLENVQARISNQITFYQHVSASKELRDASNEADKRLREFSIESGLRQDVYKAIHAVYENELDKLEGEDKRFLKKLHRQYERNGLNKPENVRDQIKNLKQKLSTYALEFSKNLGEETEHIWFTKEELDGVPEDVVAQFEQDNGKYKMTFKYPDLFPVLKYAKNPETRKRAFVGDQNKVKENGPLLKQAVETRAELAKLLGYENFSEYILEERMAKTPKTVMDFLVDLRDKLKPLGKQEIKSLGEMKLKDTGNSEYYVWDHRYYHNKMLEEQYQVDEKQISEYFPLKQTIERMLAIYEKIFQLKFKQVENPKTWHSEVQQFSVWKTDSKEEFVGYLYFDLHPREGKYGHAANFGLAPGYIDVKTGKQVYPSTSLVCNFTRDLAKKPSLLKHDEVVTFFHELGHGIHDLLGETKYARFHGTSVSWDFVEMPSQLLEYFCWSKNQLKFLSGHYETGEALPDNLIDSLIKSKNVNGALFNLRQLHFGLFDMSLHTSVDGKVDMDGLWNDLREEVALVKNGGQTTTGYASFGHLMGGYASGYYGYLWSQVFAADIFYTKFKEDPFNVKSGLEYRRKVLEKGGSQEEMDLLVDLLGRNPSSDAFLQELGLQKASG
ncbi:hypothetical protein KL939_004245 [Ogataea angusta]|nr:hypothetical protein KL939_004245 [Ogataea angusta]